MNRIEWAGWLRAGRLGGLGGSFWGGGSLGPVQFLGTSGDLKVALVHLLGK